MNSERGRTPNDVALCMQIHNDYARLDYGEGCQTVQELENIALDKLTTINQALQIQQELNTACADCPVVQLAKTMDDLPCGTVNSVIQSKISAAVVA